MKTTHLGMAVMPFVLLAACSSGGGSTGAPTPNPGPVLDNTITYTGEAPQRFASVAPDVDLPGDYAVSDAVFYDFDDIVVSDGETGTGYTADIDGWIRYPTDAAPSGGWPVILYLHGRHVTCEYAGGFEFLGSGECPDTDAMGSPLVVTRPIASYQGYDYMAETLASHGYVVISANANDVNDKDLAGDAGVQARAQIILHTLDLFRDINVGNRTSDDGDALEGNSTTNDFSALVGAMDFSRVGLMGHSRGGQAVSHTVNYNRGSDRGAEGEFNAPHNLVAVFALAPTDFDEITVTNTVFATLLPYCDGDVSNLQGARTFDHSRYAEGQESGVIFQLLTMGTNHNYYNTVWVDDDYSDGYAYCSEDAADSGRDTPEEQRRHGEFLMSSFFRLFVGGETAFLPYWQGKAQLPASACPLDDEGNPASPCDDHVKLSVIADPANRLVVEDTLTADTITANDLAGTSLFEGFTLVENCTPSTSGTGCPSDPSYSRAPQIAVSWDGLASYQTSFDELDITALDTFSLRAGVNEDETRNGSGQDFTVVLTDAEGRSASVLASDYSDALFYPPGDASYAEGKKLTLNSVLLPLAAFTGIDQSRIVQLDLVFDQEAQGDIQLSDLMFQNLSLAQSLPAALSNR